MKHNGPKFAAFKPFLSIFQYPTHTQSVIMNSNGTMFGMCNPEATGVYGHHPHHQSQHYASSAADLGSPAYCGGGSGVSGVPNSEPSSGNGGHHYGLQAAQAAAAAAAAAASVAVSESGGGSVNNATVNNNRSNSVEASGGQNSPTGIISDNGLQYANLDGSGGPVPGGGGVGYPGGYHGHHQSMAAAAAGYYHSDIHGDGSSLAAAQAAAGAQAFSSAYLDNSTAAAAAAYAQSQYPSIYGQHPHSLKSIRGSAGVHDFSPSPYQADFAAAAAISKPSQPAVPTYKWMQVKRNVPKPGRFFMSTLLLFYFAIRITYFFFGVLERKIAVVFSFPLPSLALLQLEKRT